MLNKKSWCEFRKTGLLWFVNSILHLFGWVIVFEFSDGARTFEDDTELTAVYPARTKYRGFSEMDTMDGYKKVTEYLKENVDELLEEARDEQT